MRLRSTGFGGDRELKGHVSDLSPVGKDLLVMTIQTTDPVRWQLKAGLQFGDIPKLLIGFIKPSVLPWVIRALLFPRENPREPDEF